MILSNPNDLIPCKSFSVGIFWCFVVFSFVLFLLLLLTGQSKANVEVGF